MLCFKNSSVCNWADRFTICYYLRQTIELLQLSTSSYKCSCFTILSMLFTFDIFQLFNFLTTLYVYTFKRAGSLDAHFLAQNMQNDFPENLNTFLSGVRGGPLMIWGVLGQKIRVEFFFPQQLAVEVFFFPRQLAVGLFFPERVAVGFFFSLLPRPPQIINGLPLMSDSGMTMIDHHYCFSVLFVFLKCHRKFFD